MFHILNYKDMNNIDSGNFKMFSYVFPKQLIIKSYLWTQIVVISSIGTKTPAHNNVHIKIKQMIR